MGDTEPFRMISFSPSLPASCSKWIILWCLLFFTWECSQMAYLVDKLRTVFKLERIKPSFENGPSKSESVNLT